MSAPTTYDVFVSIGPYTGVYWDEKQQGLVIPYGWQDKGAAEEAAAGIRQRGMRVTVIPRLTQDGEALS